jgi:hypothetical protein
MHNILINKSFYKQSFYSTENKEVHSLVRYVDKLAQAKYTAIFLIILKVKILRKINLHYK